MFQLTSKPCGNHFEMPLSLKNAILAVPGHWCVCYKLYRPFSQRALWLITQLTWRIRTDVTNNIKDGYAPFKWNSKLWHCDIEPVCTISKTEAAKWNLTIRFNIYYTCAFIHVKLIDNLSSQTCGLINNTLTHWLLWEIFWTLHANWCFTAVVVFDYNCGLSTSDKHVAQRHCCHAVNTNPRSSVSNTKHLIASLMIHKTCD